MQHYVLLFSWTIVGVENVKDTIKRERAFTQLVEKNGGKLLHFLYTMGQYDGVAILDFPNDESVMKVILKTESLGNAKTQILKGFTPTEIAKVLPP